jgi:arylsulfatase A-like enzyme
VRILPVLLAAITGATMALAAEPSTRPPNLIVILADDLGYGDVCVYGCPLGGKTPNIDALAQGGMRFTQAYVTAAVCGPSRAGLMTGRYQQRFGHELNAGGTARAVKEGLGTPLDATYTESCSNDPLLAGKLTPFEGGSRVPFMASWKGTIAPGRVSGAMVSTLDLLPTALELSGSTAAPPKPLDGESLLPILRGERESLARDTLVWRVGDHYAVRQGDWKLVQFLDRPPMLFDLAKDPGERADLGAKEAKKVAELEAIYQAWKAQTVAPLWQTRGDMWVPLQDLLDNKPLHWQESPGPGLIRLPV